jgi:hypothetical protein
MQRFFIMTHVRTSEGYDVKVPSNGQVNLNTVLGALGTAGFLMGTGNGCNGGILGNLLGGNRNNCGCNEDHLVNRYELAMEKELAAKDSKIALLESTIFTDKKSLELYQYIDGQLTDIRGQLCAQAVHNQRTEDSFALAQADLKAVKQDLECKINREAERRCCNDSAIVNYVNATFYPKMAADVTTGTATTAQTLYNPVASCGKGCDCGC